MWEIQLNEEFRQEVLGKQNHEDVGAVVFNTNIVFLVTTQKSTRLA